MFCRPGEDLQLYSQKGLYGLLCEYWLQETLLLAKPVHVTKAGAEFTTSSQSQLAFHVFAGTSVRKDSANLIILPLCCFCYLNFNIFSLTLILPLPQNHIFKRHIDCWFCSLVFNVFVHDEHVSSNLF